MCEQFGTRREKEKKNRDIKLEKAQNYRGCCQHTDVDTIARQYIFFKIGVLSLLGKLVGRRVSVSQSVAGHLRDAGYTFYRESMLVLG